MFFAPFVPFFDPRVGRPSTPMEVYYCLDLTAAIDYPSTAHPVVAVPPLNVAAPRHALDDVLDEYGIESFPASDPPSSWWGGTGDTW